MSKVKVLQKKITALVHQMENEKALVVHHEQGLFRLFEKEGTYFWLLFLFSAFGIGWYAGQSQKKRRSFKRGLEFIFFSFLPQLKSFYNLLGTSKAIWFQK